METVVLALAFGVSQKINYPLKREVENLVNVKSYPVYTQHDLGSILELKSGTPLIIARQSNDHVSTLALVEQFAQAAKINKWEVVKLVAARQHIWRCGRDLKKILPEICFRHTHFAP